MADQASMLEEALAGNFRTERRKHAGQEQGSNDPLTKNGYDRAEVVSALQKAIRRNHEPQALYWATELMESGSVYQMWRRLLVIAAEDVGLADPDMLPRIMSMKLAHDMGREWNIPFLAIMLLCRSPKNREADDAAYYYEMRRKEGWRIPMPPEAVDGHTGRGRKALYARARDRDEEWTDTWNWEFYGDAALLENYVEIETKGEPERYKKLLMDYLRLPYDTYDIATCKLPRMLSGPESKTAARAERVIPDAVKYEPYADPETGEVKRDTYWVTSFTNPEIRYVVDLYNDECSCPAFQKGGGTLCKHLVMLRRKEKVDR